jgi:hypothetical protein
MGPVEKGNTEETKTRKFQGTRKYQGDLREQGAWKATNQVI